MIKKFLRKNTLTILIVISVFVWIVTTVIDSIVLHNGKANSPAFLDLLIFDIPEMFLFHRVLFVLIGAFLTSLILLYNSQKETKLSNKRLDELNLLLQQKVEERTKELNDANIKLENLNNTKSDILSLISHELRTPLSIIMGFANVLITEIEELQHKEVIQLIIDSAKRLNKFADSALLITKLKLKEQKVNSLQVKLEAFLNNIVLQFNDNYYNNLLKITRNIQLENLFLEIDEYLITYSLNCIFDNAVRFSPEKSEVYLIISSEGNFIKFCIQDNGKGFSDIVLPRIFEPFTITNVMHHSEGLGLSLAVVKLITDIHNGKVQARNNENGAEVSIFLPYKTIN